MQHVRKKLQDARCKVQFGARYMMQDLRGKVPVAARDKMQGTRPGGKMDVARSRMQGIRNKME